MYFVIFVKLGNIFKSSSEKKLKKERQLLCFWQKDHGMEIITVAARSVTLMLLEAPIHNLTLSLINY